MQIPRPRFWIPAFAGITVRPDLACHSMPAPVPCSRPSVHQPESIDVGKVIRRSGPFGGPAQRRCARGRSPESTYCRGPFA